MQLFQEEGISNTKEEMGLWSLRNREEAWVFGIESIKGRKERGEVKLWSDHVETVKKITLRDGKPLDCFKQEKKMIRFKFLKGHSVFGELTRGFESKRRNTI